MDLFIDEDFMKMIKPIAFGLLGIGILYGLNYGFGKFDDFDLDNDNQNGQQPEKQIKKKPAGIFNQGNTCFVNSLLQALGSLTQFVENLNYFISNYQQNLSYEQMLMLELRNSLLKINHGEQNVDISKLLQLLAESSNLINYEQQDAYELYSVFIASFEKVRNRQKIKTLSKSFIEVIEEENDNQRTMTNSLHETYENCMVQKQEDQNCLLGYTKSSITCTGCNLQKNIKIDAFYDLSVDISHPNINEIQEAIRNFQRKEVISDWICVFCSVQEHIKKIRRTCEKLKKQVENGGMQISDEERNASKILIIVAQDIIKFCQQQFNNDELEITDINDRLSSYITKYEPQYQQLSNYSKQRDTVFLEISEIKRTIFKQTLISKYPKILVIHLKRVTINPFSGEPVLLRKFIDFPKDLKIDVRQGSKNYTLNSLLSHMGNESMGHYYTYRKTSGNSLEWYLISDTYTKQCRWNALKKGVPYMLFYEIQEIKKTD